MIQRPCICVVHMSVDTIVASVRYRPACMPVWATDEFSVSLTSKMTELLSVNRHLEGKSQAGLYSVLHIADNFRGGMHVLLTDLLK